MAHRTSRSPAPLAALAGFAAVAVVATVAAVVATPAHAVPDAVQYHGILRDASGAPVDGEVDAVFRLFDAETAGDEILRDSHLAANGQALAVDDGLFAARIGRGLVEDGAGPDVFDSLAAAFRLHPRLWLEVELAGETLAPRVEIVASGYALFSESADRLGTRSAADFLDTTTAQTKGAPLAIDSSDTGVPGLVVSGWGTAASFADNSGYVGYADLGTLGYGIQAGGQFGGGIFEDTDDGSIAYLAYAGEGIKAVSPATAGTFENATTDAVSYLGTPGAGIVAQGPTRGGQFLDTGGTSSADLAYGGYGIQAAGISMGGYFEDSSGSGRAEVGYGGTGIVGRGENAGGFFADDTTGTWTHTAYGDSSTRGSGAKNFVQNHPEDPALQVVYAAIEGDEVATYTRGRAQLADGVARVRLGETFRLVTNPDFGLTAHLTARGEPVALAIEELGTDRLVVRGPAGSAAAFDYLVQGLRIGFEDAPVVREKPPGLEALLPNAAETRAMLARSPDLAETTPRARFLRMRAGLASAERAPDDAGERALVEAIGRFDPALHAAPGPAPDRGAPGPRGARGPRRPAATEIAQATGVERATVAATVAATDAATVACDAAPPEAGSHAGVATFELAGPASDGDLLMLDPDRSGRLRRTDGAPYAETVGVAVAIVARSDARSDAPEDARPRAAVRATGIVRLRVDAGYGTVRPGDRLVPSPTPGHAMRAGTGAAGAEEEPVAVALEGIEVGSGLVRALLRR